MRARPYLILFILALSACGQKGGLYIPQESPPPKPAEQETKE